mgnify:CR=1 FL=1
MPYRYHLIKVISIESKTWYEDDTLVSLIIIS